MQHRHRRTASPTASSTDCDSADVIISIDMPPVLSLVFGETIATAALSSSSTHESVSLGSSTTLGKGVVTTSMSAVSGDGDKTCSPVPSSTSRSSGGGSFPTGTIGDTVHRAPSQAEGNRKHVRLTCIPFPGGATYYHPAPTVTAKTSDVYGAAVFTMETITNHGTIAQTLTMTPTSSDTATSTSSGGPVSSNTSQVQPNRRHFPREAIIAIAVALMFVLIGSVVLILRRRRILLRNQVPPIMNRSSQKHRDDLLAQPRNSLRNFTFGPRSKWSDSSNNDEEVALARPEFSENEGSTRTGKRLPSVIIQPSASNFYRREDQDRLSISSNISTDSQYILAQPRQTTTDVDLPIPDPFSPPIPVTPTGSFISIPDITVHPPNSSRVTSYRPIDRVIPPIPPVPSSPPPLPPGSPSRASRDPFKDPPSPSTS